MGGVGVPGAGDLAAVAGGEEEVGAGAMAIRTMVRSSARTTPCGTPAGAAMKSPGPAAISRSATTKVAFPLSTT